MNKVKIIVDSTSDLENDYIKKPTPEKLLN